MKKINREYLIVIISVTVTACILALVNYLAVIYCVENLEVFATLVLLIPIICIIIAAFFIGYQIKWDWKKGISISLVLTFISFGISQLAAVKTGDKLDNIGMNEFHDNIKNSSNDEMMDELYEELDKKAYEYMISQGIILEGEKIYGGEGEMGDEVFGNSVENEDIPEGKIISSELYVGIQKSDSVTELISNVITFFGAFGFSFVGNLVKVKRKINME